MNYKYTLLFLILYLLSISASAQQYLFDAQHITSDDGIANLMTTSIYKDKRGFIWMGTAYGLNRYDGYNFKLFTQEKNNLYLNGKIGHIREDEQGRLWLFYRVDLNNYPRTYPVEALDIFDPKTGQAISFQTLFADNTPFHVNEICLPKILDPQNRLWIHTNKGELFLYTHGRFKKIFQQEGAFSNVLRSTRKRTFG